MPSSSNLPIDAEVNACGGNERSSSQLLHRISKLIAIICMALLLAQIVILIYVQDPPWFKYIVNATMFSTSIILCINFLALTSSPLVTPPRSVSQSRRLAQSPSVTLPQSVISPRFKTFPEILSTFYTYNEIVTICDHENARGTTLPTTPFRLTASNTNVVDFNKEEVDEK